MATRKKASSASPGRTGSKGARKAPAGRTVRRKSKAEPADEPVATPAPKPRAVRGAAATSHQEVPMPTAVAPPAPPASPAKVAPPMAVQQRSVAPAAPMAVAPPPPSSSGPVRSGSRAFVVARGDDAVRVFAETLKHAGFFEKIENAQINSGKKRELFEVACKVDFMTGVRVENEPLSYVDPRLVTHLFNELLDRGFRILRVVETRNEHLRYLRSHAVKQCGRALGFDESCYEIKDLADDLVPVELGLQGRRATGRAWKSADYRIVFAKNRTDELFGPTLVLYNVWRTLATPTDLVALDYGIDPGDLALAMLEKVPVHFALIDAVHARDGSPGNVFPYELLREAEGSAIEGAQVHRLGTVLGGSDVLSVEAAGQKMQGLDPVIDPWFLKRLRKATGWKPAAEVDGLPNFPGWRGIGARGRDALGIEKPAENARVALLASLSQADHRLFPPQPSAYQMIRLRQKVETFLGEVRRRGGLPMVAAVEAAPSPFAPPHGGS